MINNKKILLRIFHFIVGFILLYVISNVFMTFLFLLNNLINLDIFVKGVKIIVFIIALIGGCSFVYCDIKNKPILNIWRINKAKLITNLILVLVLISVMNIIIQEFNFVLIVFETILLFILSYPFSALLIHLLTNFKNIKNKYTLIILLIIINPLFLNLSINLNSQFFLNSNNTETIDCGVIIKGLSENSPLEDWTLNKQLISINDIKVSEIYDLRPIFSSINSTDTINVNIQNQTLKVRPYYDEKTQMYTLGLTLQKISCR